jgi:ferric-dicitrate binding protein FerR (iron transport regulator)
MKHSSNSRIDALVSEQAAAWFVRLVENDLSLRERREYLAWLKTSALHVEALLDIYRYHGYGRKAKLNARIATDPDPGANVIPFLPRDGSSVALVQDREVRRRRVGTIKVAAVLAGVMVSLFVVGFAVKANYFDKRFATGPGEWDKTLLADGSVLRIGPNTTLRWSFSDTQRTIVLSRGEALFEVAKDPQRPFIVTTRIGDVRAVGTEFGVSLMSASTVVVTVAHGKVAVSKPNNGRFLVNDMSGTVATLVADEQLVMSANQVEPVKQVNSTRELQWASGYYEFRGETVNHAVEQFNRRNRLQVVLADPAIGNIPMPFTTVRLDDPESFALMLGARADVQVAYENADVIRLMPE